MPSIKRGPDDDDDDVLDDTSHPHQRNFAQELAVAAGNYANVSPSGPPPRKRNTGNTRTGQACDRCKLRKIRCDATPGGCTPCRQNASECRTTDRITGRATARGHTEQLENEVTGLKMYVIELQAQLRSSGVEPLAPPADMPPDAQVYNMSSQEQQHDGYSAHRQDGKPAERHNSQGSLLPEFRQGCIGDNYLGVASENNWLSPIEGTSLALFGTKIDLAEFVAPEPHPEISAMSYQTFLSQAFSKTTPPPPKPDLPSFDDYKMYAGFYFIGIQPFIPILHQPDFMPLVSRVYFEGYQPNAAEETMIHMILAVMFFQWSARNPIGSEQFRTSSFQHYHYCLSMIPQLISSHKLQDIQALSLICSYLRSQPRPGAAWMFSNLVLGLAIESGLHRSVKAWPTAAAEEDAHTVEMRKRVFWSIIVLHVAISGKLGRPMPLRLEDFDIEIPKPVNDSWPTEGNAPKGKKCSFRAGIQGFKLLRIQMRVYSTIYSVKSGSEPYEVNVKQLEKDLEAFQSQIPQELAGGPQTREEDRVPALYLQLSITECDLLLHHPSLNRSSSPQTAAANLELCLDASQNMLMAAIQLKQLKSLDTTWYYATGFLAAIFTTLFAYYEKRDSLTQENVQRLRQDMDQWLEVIGDVGNLLGTGPKLQAATRSIVDYSLAHINRRITEQTASAASAAIASEAPQNTSQHQQQQPQPQSYGGQDYYAPSSHYNTYPDPQTTSAQYQHNAPIQYDTSSYNADGMRHNIEAQLNSDLGNPTAAPQQGHHTQAMHEHHQQTSTNFAMAFQPPATPQSAYHQQHAAFPHSGLAAWRHFADNMMINIPTPEHYAAAANMSAIPAPGTDAGGLASAAASFGGMQMPTDPTQAWPGIVNYGIGPSGHGE